jgi:hypothetical protein
MLLSLETCVYNISIIVVGISSSISSSRISSISPNTCTMHVDRIKSFICRTRTH